MATTYKITLEADGFDAINLPVSAFSYRSSDQSFTGSCTVEGHEFSGQIADRIAGTLRLIKIVNGVETEILTASIDSIASAYDPNALSPNPVTLTLEFSATYTQTAYTETLLLSSISSAANQNSKWSFKIPDIDPQIQHGIMIEYHSIEYYIGDISVSYSANSFGGMTLNEWDKPLSQEGSSGTCTFELVSGVPVAVNLSSASCVLYSGYYNPNYAAIRDNFYVVYPMRCRLKYFNFELTEESEVVISVDGSMPDMKYYTMFYGQMGYDGFECMISAGGFEWAENISLYSLAKIYCGGTYNATLPAGLYTVRTAHICDILAPEDNFTLSFEVI